MSLLASADAGLTDQGVQAVVGEGVDLSGWYREPQTATSFSLYAMLRALVVSEEPVSRSDLLVHHRGVEGGDYDPDRGRYSSRMSRDWFADVGRPALLSLPGVSEADGGLAFTGVDASDYAEDETRPLDEFRSDPLVRVEAALDRFEVPRDADRRDDYMSLVAHLAAVESAPTEELDRKLRRTDAEVADLAPTLETLPGVERETETPPSPSEIEVSTMMDVLEGYERLDRDATEVWRFAPDVPADTPSAGGR